MITIDQHRIQTLTFSLTDFPAAPTCPAFAVLTLTATTANSNSSTRLYLAPDQKQTVLQLLHQQLTALLARSPEGAEPEGEPTAPATPPAEPATPLAQSVAKVASRAERRIAKARTVFVGSGVNWREYKPDHWRIDGLPDPLFYWPTTKRYNTTQSFGSRSGQVEPENMPELLAKLRQELEDYYASNVAPF